MMNFNVAVHIRRKVKVRIRVDKKVIDALLYIMFKKNFVKFVSGLSDKSQY